MKKTVIQLVIFITIISLLSGCSISGNPDDSGSENLTRYSNTTIDSGFNTFLNIIGWCNDKDEFDNYFDIAVDDFNSYNQLFDIYHNYEGINNIKTINDNAGVQAVTVDPEIVEMLDLAQEFSEMSDNEFDVTFGAVLKIWHSYRELGIQYNDDGEYGPLPDLSQLEEAAANTGWQFVEIDHENNTVFITNPEASIDVGSIAKGFTAEKVARHLESLGLTYGVVNAGGNNRTINAKPDGSGYTVGVQNPGGDTPTLVTIDSPGKSSSFVTSGDYQNYYIGTDGNVYHHIINPETLYPADYFHSVTIVCSNSGIADAFSTTLFTLSYEDGLALVNSYNKDNPDNQVDVVWVMDSDREFETENGMRVQDYFVVWTDGLRDRIGT